MLVAVIAMAASTTAFMTRPRQQVILAHPDALAVAEAGHYLGVAEANEIASYSPISEFADATGINPNIVLYYSAWEDPFQTRLANAARAHGAVPFVQINPGQVSMAAIAAGGYDVYLRSYADQVRAYGYPVIVGFAPEMNGPWYPWGWHHTKPAVWIAAWRHLVTVFRGQGVSNVIWLWTISATNLQSGPIRNWWPGGRYVTWVGIDGYYFRPADTFSSIFGGTLNHVRSITGDRVLISETAVGPVAGPAKIGNLFAGVEKDRLLGLVWFDQTQHMGIYHQNWRLEGRPGALAAFRRAAASYEK